MKKFFVSVGLVAAGTAGLQAAYTPGLGPMQTTKLWSVSATLRGFYDDNYDTANSGLNPRGSYGFEVSPQIQLAVPLQQTELGLRYTYGLYYYQERDSLGQNPIDQSHQVDLWVDHAFTERWQATVQDSLAVAQEPSLLTPSGQPTSLPVRVNGNNIANTGTLTLNTDWTRLFSTSLAYNNSFYDFQNSGSTLADVQPVGVFPYPPGEFPGATGLGASLAGMLDRIEQTVSLDFQWHTAPETMVFFGAAFGQINYTGNEPIAYNELSVLGPQFGPAYYYSDNRDNRSYTGYLGFQHSFLPNLNLSVRAGAQYVDNYNEPINPTYVDPYASLSLVYTYSPGSYAQLGFTQARNASDIVTVNVNQNSANPGQLTLDQESSLVFASINQKITPKLTGTVIGSWQYSFFEGGAYANQAQQVASLGLNLSYLFNQHFSADAGYNFDDLWSDVPGWAYTRNRVYLGVTATY